MTEIVYRPEWKFKLIDVREHVGPIDWSKVKFKPVQGEIISVRELRPAGDVAAHGFELGDEAADRVLGEEDVNVVTGLGAGGSGVEVRGAVDEGGAEFDILRPDRDLLKFLGHCVALLRSWLKRGTVPESPSTAQARSPSPCRGGSEK